MQRRIKLSSIEYIIFMFEKCYSIKACVIGIYLQVHIRIIQNLLVYGILYFKASFGYDLLTSKSASCRREMNRGMGMHHIGRMSLGCPRARLQEDGNGFKLTKMLCMVVVFKGWKLCVKTFCSRPSEASALC
jgi:hypothetical protein